MTNINNLFCTPDQGRRIQELVTTIEPAMWWVDFGNGWEDRPYFRDEFVVPYSFQYTPALTLQELRDVIKKADYDKFKRDKVSILDSFDHHELENLLDVGTAPKLAAWVIERLEGQS